MIDTAKYKVGDTVYWVCETINRVGYGPITAFEEEDEEKFVEVHTEGYYRLMHLQEVFSRRNDASLVLVERLRKQATAIVKEIIKIRKEMGESHGS